MEPSDRIKLSSLLYQSKILSLNEDGKWSRNGESNSGLRFTRAALYRLSYSGLIVAAIFLASGPKRFTNVRRIGAFGYRKRKCKIAPSTIVNVVTGDLDGVKPSW